MTDLEKITTLAPSTLERFHLDGKVALVVGGTKGLGQAMALALAAAGADVCVASRGPDGLEETRTAIEAIGRRSHAYAVDVSRESDVADMMGAIEKQFGSLDILVNSQGMNILKPITEYDVDDWQRVIDVNLKSVFLCCKYAARIMLEKGKGKIINISSVRGFQGRAEDPAYAPSKGAVNQLTRSMAIEWGPLGINVNGIAPVFTLTAISAKFLADPAKKEWVMSRIPMKRLGELEDLFGPVVFLASEASNFVNGHTLPVDGGWLGA